MRIIAILIFCFTNFTIANAQLKNGKKAGSQNVEREKYFTFNPLALAEPQIAIGAGFGSRFTDRSEFFAEISYLLKQPFYNAQPEGVNLSGYRLIAQYRYHFLQRSRPNSNMGQNVRRRNARHNPFIAVEFRIKSFNYPMEKVLVNYSTFDTLQKMTYQSNNFNIGAALLFGETYDISEHWKIELTVGVGGKERTIRYKKAKAGYEEIRQRRPDSYSPLDIDNPGTSPYFPFSFRLKYLF